MSFLGAFRRKLVAGILIIVPVVVTILVLEYVFRTLDRFLGPMASELLGRRIPGLGILATFLLVLVAGLLGTNFLGRKVLHFIDRLMKSVPMARTIYKGSREILLAVMAPNRESFKDVVMLEYPSKDRFAYGFVTSYATREIAGSSEAIANVYIPSAPLPTSGPLVAVRVEDLIYLDMSVDEALRLIVSGGIVAPETIRLRRRTGGEETP
jgi:uncharacterized membrane protein